MPCAEKKRRLVVILAEICYICGNIVCNEYSFATQNRRRIKRFAGFGFCTEASLQPDFAQEMYPTADLRESYNII